MVASSRYVIGTRIGSVVVEEDGSGSGKGSSRLSYVGSPTAPVWFVDILFPISLKSNSWVAA